MSTIEESIVQLKGYSIPKQFREAVEIVDVVSTVSSNTAEQMNEEFRVNCAVHDVEDIESMVAANTTYAGS